MTAALAKTHENYSHDWWTPTEWLEWVHESFMCQTYFDPCPQTWSDAQGSGLCKNWGPRNYVNHPGARGSSAIWWAKANAERALGKELIWCAFSVEQLRHMRPSPFRLPGWLVLPRERIGFVWGGPDMYRIGKSSKLYTESEIKTMHDVDTVTLARKHGEQQTSPGNWTVFWASVKPAPTPVASEIVRTGL